MSYLGRRRPRRGRKLFWHVYLNGMLLVTLAGVAVGTSEIARGHLWREDPEEIAVHLNAHWREHGSTPELLADALRGVGQSRETDVSIYRLGGTLIATNVEPPLPPLSSAEVERLTDHPLQHASQRWSVALPILEEGRPVAYAVMLHLTLKHALAHAATFTVMLFVLALGSIPLARAIAAPLERLTEVAERLGSGDLSVRSGIRRAGEIGKLASAFDAMADRAEKLVRTEKELLANVSHELHTPLACVRVALEMVAEGDRERAAKYLSEIGRDLDELDGLIADVLTAARLEFAAGAASEWGRGLCREAIGGRELVERAADRFRTAHPACFLELAFSGPLPTVLADATLLCRAIDNVLDNARKYSAEDQSIVLAAREQNAALVVEVPVRGIGVEPQDLPKLFTPFFRTDRSRSRGTGGVGLGLALARRIVEAHGGRISVESPPGRGTSVQLTVPAA